METTTIVKIHDLARAGTGVSRDTTPGFEGRVLFVPYTAPGDLVRVQIVKESKRYAEAILVEVLEPSPLRQTPRCPAFGRCGGCQWQHLPYDYQWQTKSQGVLQALKRVGVKAPDQIDLIPAVRIWEYRNRVQARGLQNEMGFYQAGSNQLVPVSRCDLARPEINRVWDDVRTEGQKFSEPYKVELELSPEGKVSRAWNSGHSAHGFRQVHDEQNDQLRTWVASQVPASSVLYDLFGGGGNLSLPLTGKMGEIHCVDLSVPLQKSPEIPEHFHFHRSSVVAWLLKGAGKRSGVAAAILDPPRVGLGTDFPVIAKAMEGLNVRSLVCVGCDADAWCRDVSRWVKRGWKFEKMMLIDLFPQTAHVESVGLLTR